MLRIHAVTIALSLLAGTMFGRERRVGGMEFLFDDDLLDYQAGVRRVAGEVAKEPEPLFAGSSPWEQPAPDALLGVIYDQQENTFKLWYKSSLPQRNARGRRYFVCYAEGRDGVHWERPAINLVEFDGNRRNNIVAEVADRDTVFYNIFKDPADPRPERRYKALGFDTTRKSALKDRPNGGAGVAVAYSADGLRWPKEPTLVMYTGDVTDADSILAAHDSVSGRWVAYLRPRTVPKRRFIGYSESSDFDHWTYPQMLLTPGSGDSEDIEFYGMAIAPVSTWLAGAVWVFHNNPFWSPVTNELVYSRDGRHYRRAMPGRSWIPNGPKGSFDSVSLTPKAIIERGSEFLIYYSGSNSTHGSDRAPGVVGLTASQTPEGEQRKNGLGVAHLKWGHFCGLRADHYGVVETRWITNYGQDGMKAVADIENGGYLQAEVLDQYGHVIPGWSRQESRSRVDAADHGKLRFWWSEPELVGRNGQISKAGGAVGHVVKLRFYLHKATLYGFQVGSPGEMPEYAR